MTTIAISDGTKKELLRLVSELQIKLGRKVNYDEAIKFILARTHRLEPELLKEACSEVENPDDIIQSLYRERKKDEQKYERYLRR